MVSVSHNSKKSFINGFLLSFSKLKLDEFEVG